MIIIPAIDIRQGKCVRLYQGDFSKSTKVAEDPVKVAESFQETGAQYIHMVDLDGALEGRPVNEDIIINVVSQVKVPVELGGGIRDLRTIDRLINKGISRVILGSLCLEKSTNGDGSSKGIWTSHSSRYRCKEWQGEHRRLVKYQ